MSWEIMALLPIARVRHGRGGVNAQASPHVYLGTRGGRMSKDHHAGYASKHPEGTVLNESVEAALRERSRDGEISCAAAHRVANDLGQHPETIGTALDLMEIRLTKCQMGLFGYAPDKRIVSKADQWPAELEADIRGALRNGRLPCVDAWALAERHAVSRMAVANVCEALALKIKPCQLGAF
jgi:hypothetical protein